MNKTIKGKNLMVFVDGKSIALATSHTLDITINTIDTTTKDVNGLWTDAEVSNMSWSLSSDNLVSIGTDGHDTASVVDMALEGAKVEVAFSLASPLDSNVPTGGFVPFTHETETEFNYSGQAIITSVSISASNGEKASYSISFTGCGALSKI